MISKPQPIGILNSENIFCWFFTYFKAFRNQNSGFCLLYIISVRQKMQYCESQDLLCLMAVPITFCPELRLITICTGPTRSGPVHTSAGNIVQIGHCPLFLPSCCVFSLPVYGPIVIPAADPSQRECVAAFPVAAHLNSLSLHDPDHRLSG